MAKRECKILIIDDSEDDRFFLKRGLKRKLPECRVVATAHDGEMAIEYLSGSQPFNNRVAFPFPDLILLDLKMPRKDGLEVLRWLRNEKVTGLRVIVLSTSGLSNDIEQAKALGADAYLQKQWVSDASASEIARFVEANDWAIGAPRP